MTEGEDGDDGAIWDRQRNAAMERLEQAEKVAERIVSKRIPQAVQKVQTSGGAAYARHPGLSGCSVRDICCSGAKL